MRAGKWLMAVMALAVSQLAGADELVLKEGATLDIGGKKATVKKCDMLPYRETAFSAKCVYDKFENPKLTELRTKYQLDRVIAPGKTEIEKQALLAHWAKNRFDFGDPVRETGTGDFEKMGGLRNALKILDLAQKEQKFFCVQYASVLISASASLGWICRPMGHATHTWTEMWSNQFGRWAHFDPTADYYWEKGGIPIDTYGAQAAVKAGAKDLTVVINGQKTNRSIRPYTRYQYITHNTWMDMDRGYGGSYTLSADDNRGGFSRDSLTDQNASDVVLFPIDQAALSFTPKDGGLEVAIKTMTPNFKTFQVRFDEKAWKDSGDKLTWALHAGRNVLEAKSVNKFGVDGYVSAVILEVAP